MRTTVLFASVLLLVLAVVVSSPVQARAGTFIGYVVHVSTTNIKAKDNSGAESTFLLAPSFDQVFSSDGKSTYQMKDLKPGTHVKIEYSSMLNGHYCNKISILHP